MTPRAFLIRSLVPAITLSREAEDLGLYGAAAARSWSHFPHMLRIDGLTMGQLKGLREKARLLKEKNDNAIKLWEEQMADNRIRHAQEQDALKRKEQAIYQESLRMAAEEAERARLRRYSRVAISSLRGFDSVTFPLSTS